VKNTGRGLFKNSILLKMLALRMIKVTGDSRKLDNGTGSFMTLLSRHIELELSNKGK
jgi:hypothetical protein